MIIEINIVMISYKEMNFDFDLIPKARNPKLYIKTINFFPVRFETLQNIRGNKKSQIERKL